jgi:tetratricopeptide (TPR) repeat protein
MRPLFEIDQWRKNQEGSFVAREEELMKALVVAEPELRPKARLELARFYMARGMYAEAKGVTDAVLGSPNAKVEESVALSIHGISSLLIGRPADGLKDLASPVIGNSFDSELWKGLAYARQEKWADAREKFKNVDFVIAALPVELQRIVTMEAMRASLEVKDFAGAAKRRSELEVVGVPPVMQPTVAVLRGRLSEALGHDKDALDEYSFAANSSDRAAAAEAKLLRLALRQRHNELTQADLLRELETLAVTWRGDATEVKTLQMLSRIYSDTGRYAESLTAARTATKLQPNSDMSRQAQDAASTLFSQIFLSQKGDEIPPIDALSIFYEFRELTPIGRRGDEMIRRLADRLVGVDLLDQAAELLQYQVDRRLEGAARAQVAARLAMVYLTNRKPERAIAALSSTRIADLSGELRQQRLLLESRAQSDIGRHDLALDIISNLRGREAVRLRSDIYWAARRWRESSEQIELYYGDRWRDFKALSATERGDVIRAVIGYALAEDSLGLARFREKYAPLMTVETDRLAFDVASKPSAGSSAEFAEIAKMAASVDTLDGFLREMKARFPEASTRAPLAPEVKADPTPTGSLPRIVGAKRAEAVK